MRPPAFASAGRFFRGNLHAHSNRSDGMAPVEQVLAEYRAAGYDFLVLTDHSEARWWWSVTDTTPARDDGFTTLLGVELGGLGRRGRLLRQPHRRAAAETYNHNAAIAWPDQAEARYALDALLARGHRLHVTVGDDAHWEHRWDRFAAWVEVRAEQLSEDRRCPGRRRPRPGQLQSGPIGGADRNPRVAL